MWKKINDLSNKFFPWGCLLVSACQFFEGSCVGGLGWLISGVMWWLQEESERDFKELSQLFKDHLSDDKEKELIDIDHMDIDHILKIGREFQMSDTWRGATHDTAKLLCDTIEMLRDQKGNRNCDVYNTVEDAKVACRNDRGYCSSPIEERESTIRFMLQDVKDNSFNKSGLGMEDK